MKYFFHRLIIRWFAIMVPSYAPPTTINEREQLRKRRLLSGILLINFVTILFFVMSGFSTGSFSIQQFINSITCSVLLFLLWVNQRGYLKSATLIYAIFTFLVMTIFITFSSFLEPILAFILWPQLLAIQVVAGLFLPAWGPLLLSTLEILFMGWFIFIECQRQIALYLPDPGGRLQLLFVNCFVIFVIGIISAIYATTTRKAVVQADRAVELEQAHQTISAAYTNLEQAHATIQKQALTDGLTGLPNHRAIVDQLMKELERTRRYERPFSLLFFDADHFKHVNDTYGHGAGDAVLRQIGERAGSALRGGDTLGRFGGEEFVVLLPEADTGEATIVAERIRTTVASNVVAMSEVEGGITMTVSIGLSTYQVDGDSEEQLLSQADEAMYMAKRMGRNQIRTAEEARQMSTDVDLMALLQEETEREIKKREGVTPEQLRESYTVRCICSLLFLLERRDAGLSAHAHAVSDLATNIAQRSGLDQKDCARIGIAALLHDIGKVAIPDVLLQKINPLSLTERARIQEHAELGAQILESNPILSDLGPAVRHHHERWDGSGYPDKLAGEAIPLAARIIAVGEAYDAMQRECSYQASCSPEEAQTELRRCAGTQFDPTIVQLLLTILIEQRSLQTIG